VRDAALGATREHANATPELTRHHKRRGRDEAYETIKPLSGSELTGNDRRLSPAPLCLPTK